MVGDASYLAMQELRQVEIAGELVDGVALGRRRGSFGEGAVMVGQHPCCGRGDPVLDGVEQLQRTLRIARMVCENCAGEQDVVFVVHR